MNNLSSFGVQELNTVEIKKVDGGWGWAFAVAVAWSAWENVGEI